MNILTVTNQRAYSKVEPLSDLPVVGKSPLPEIIRENSRAYVHLGKTTKHPNISKPKRKLKSESLEIRLKTRERLVKLLGELGEDKTSKSMSVCGQKSAVLTCGQHIVAKIPFHRCNVRYCPMCASRRASRFVKKYLPFASEFVKYSPTPVTACLLTLTQRKIKGERLVKSRERMMESFKKFNRHKFFKEYFSGGVYAVENTISDEGNHTHLHIVVFRKKFIKESLLKEHWVSVSPGAKNLNIKLIDTLEGGLKECIKYISKPVPADKLERRHVKELLELKGKRMIDTFGDFRRFFETHELPEEEVPERPKLLEGQPCPCCDDGNNTLFELTMTIQDLISFHRRIEQTRGSPPLKNH